MRGMKQKKGPAPGAKAGKSKGQPSLEDFLSNRDYTGALALMEFKLKCQDGDVKDLLLWIGYCAFHLGNYRRAEDAYKELLETHEVTSEVYLNMACCYFYQQMYEEAEKSALKGITSTNMKCLSISFILSTIIYTFFDIYFISFSVPF